MVRKTASTKNRTVCDAPCPICGYKDLHCLSYACGIVALECPKCESKGTGCSIGGAYGNMKSTNDRDTRAKAALESIAESLKIITTKLLIEGENIHGN